jgi:hypothetical protein
MIAYYEPNGGNCLVGTMMFDLTPSSGGDGPTWVRVPLHPGEIFNLNRRVRLLCGSKGEMLTVLNRDGVMSQVASNFVQQSELSFACGVIFLWRASGERGSMVLGSLGFKHGGMLCDF